MLILRLKGLNEENSLATQWILSTILFKGHLHCIGHQHAYNIIIIQQQKSKQYAVTKRT